MSIDKIFAAALFLLTLPVMAAVAALSAVSTGRPVVFRQERAGEHGVPFEILKFRTMRSPRPGEDPLLTDDLRLTAVGRLLRRSSLDELPQLVNILRGEMRFIGPRPLHTSYVDRYNSEQARRLEVMPGLTGWAQVNGRNAISWEDRFALDVWYVDNKSRLVDFRILVMTIRRLMGSGASRKDTATMKQFEGSARA